MSRTYFVLALANITLADETFKKQGWRVLTSSSITPLARRK
ncbi:uncharacterized protein Dvar_16200 [Desulfosarcina variabilis str. Montpellier]